MSNRPITLEEMQSIINPIYAILQRIDNGIQHLILQSIEKNSQI